MLHLNDRCFYSCLWITPDLRCQKRLWILCFSTTSIKIWRSGAFFAFSPFVHLSEPLRKQKVVVRDLWLVDFDPFCVFLCFKVRCFVFEKHRKFYLSSKIFFIFFTLKHGKFRFQRWNCSYRASKSRGNTNTEGWKFPLTKPFAGHSLYSCSYGLYLNQTEPTVHRSTCHICDSSFSSSERPSVNIVWGCAKWKNRKSPSFVRI